MAQMVKTESLIGRQRQLAMLGECVHALAAGRGHVLMIEGEPGVGKSALLRRTAGTARANGCQVLWATCEQLNEAFPLRPLVDALDARADAGELPRISETLHAYDGSDSHVDLVATACEQLLAHIDEMCQHAPTLLVIDDVQWADAATVLTINRLRRAVRQLPLMLVCLGRPLPRRADLAALRRSVAPDGLLRLRGLTATEVATLVTAIVGAPPSPALLRLAEGAGGNPLYVTELLAALRRASALRRTVDRVEVTASRIPESLSAAIADRLEFLAEPVRDTLRVAALLGVTFSVSELAVVTGDSVVTLQPTLDEAVLAGVVHEADHELAFRHPLIHRALYQSMPTALRAAWHQEAARYLAAAGAPVNRVARQMLPACDDTSPPPDEWAVRWLADAAQHLVGIAPNATTRLMRWALRGAAARDMLRDLITCRLADALYRTGDTAAAAEVALGALVRVTRPDLTVELHSTLTQCRQLAGRSDESLAALARALDTPHLTLAQRARLLVLTARAHRFLGHVDQAGQMAERALEVAEASGDAWAIAWALSVLAVVYGVRGQHAETLLLYDKALRVSQEDPALADLRLLLLINKAVALGELDRHDEAITAAEQVRRLADQAANVVRLSQAQTALAELLFDVGRWDEALAEVDIDSDTAKDPVAQCIEQGVAATIRLHRGDPHIARDLAATEQDTAARIGGRVVGPFALARSLSREQNRTPDEALAVLLENVGEQAEEADGTIGLLPDAVRLALEVGDAARAHDLTIRAEKAASNTTTAHGQAVACHCRGLLEDDPVQLLRAANGYQQSGRPLPRAQALEAAAVALAEQDDVNKARAHFTDAYAVYTELGAAWDLARSQAKLRTYGIRRGPTIRDRRPRQGWDSLTPAELKVVAPVAQGLSNPQIATELFLSRRTVQSHISSVLAKLAIHSRVDIAREAAKHNIPPSPEVQ